MLHIILLVLKIIGIALLSILGILLFAVICVLFVPVRYRIELTREEGDEKTPLMVRARATWLLHLLNVRIRYPSDEKIVRARLFLFTIFSMPEKEKRNSGKKKKAKKPRQKDVPEGKKIWDAEEKNLNAESSTSGSEAVRHNADRVEADSNISGESASVQDEEKGAADEKLSLLQKLKKILRLMQNFFKKLREIVQNIQCTIEHFCDKMKSVLNDIMYYQEIVESDVFQNSLRLCKDELICVLKRLRPQKMQADLIIGMDDPATTGQILAVYGMLYPFIGEHVNIVGDFEQNRIEGHAFVKGKVLIVTLVRIVVRIYFNQDVKKLLKLLKKEAA